jgi:hypothetical protein
VVELLEEVELMDQEVVEQVDLELHFQAEQNYLLVVQHQLQLEPVEQENQHHMVV